MQRFFITGTDTGCGKTFVTCKMMQKLQAGGKSVRALKPVASGCTTEGEQLINEDVANILEYDKSGAVAKDICKYLLKDPIAPHIAAMDENVTMHARDIANFCSDKNLEKFDYVLVEGAGGLLVPINAKQTWVDVLKILDIQVIVVVGMRLGCINHALLTVNALENHGIPCAGWVANCIDPTMPRLQDNIDALQQRIKEPLLAIVDTNYNSLYESELSSSFSSDEELM